MRIIKNKIRYLYVGIRPFYVFRLKIYLLNYLPNLETKLRSFKIVTKEFQAKPAIARPHN